jgi:predicted  nucleic acid-binding Zn-ribbon protein
MNSTVSTAECRAFKCVDETCPKVNASFEPMEAVVIDLVNRATDAIGALEAYRNAEQGAREALRGGMVAAFEEAVSAEKDLETANKRIKELECELEDARAYISRLERII